MKEKQLVFVYGTLRKNERNHYLLEDATCIARQAWTSGELFDTGCGYPAMIQTEKNRVYGELFEVTGPQLERLDGLEGYYGEGSNNLYDRVTQTIYTDQDEHRAYVYVMDRSKTKTSGTPIEFGDWKVHRLLKQSMIPYFAYGSCMDDVRFIQAGVDHFFKNIIGRGILDGYSLRFTRRIHDGGRADVVEVPGVVEGKLYQIAIEAFPYLSRREGVKSGCYRPAIVQIRMDDQTLMDALTFVVVNKEEELAPPAHYMEEILRGGRGLLSDEYMKALEGRITQIPVKGDDVSWVQ